MLALHHMKAVLETPLKLWPKGLTVFFGCAAILLTVVTTLVLAVFGGRLLVDTRLIAATLSLNGFLAILLLLAHRRCPHSLNPGGSRSAVVLRVAARITA